MTLEVVNVTIDPAREAEYLAAHLQARLALAANPHCRSFVLQRCVEDPGRFMALIEWDSVAGHMQGFRESEAYQSFRALLHPFYLSVEMKHFEPATYATDAD